MHTHNDYCSTVTMLLDLLIMFCYVATVLSTMLLDFFIMCCYVSTVLSTMLLDLLALASPLYKGQASSMTS